MKTIVICGSLTDIDLIKELSNILEQTGLYLTIIPDGSLSRINAYLRYIDAIQNADMVLIIPKKTTKNTHFFDVTKHYRKNYNLSRYIMLLGHDIGEATTYEMCTAIKANKPTFIIRKPYIGDSIRIWGDSVIKYLQEDQNGRKTD